MAGFIYFQLRLTIGSIILPQYSTMTLDDGYPLPLVFVAAPMVLIYGTFIGLRPMRDLLPMAIVTCITACIHTTVTLKSSELCLHYVVTIIFLAMAATLSFYHIERNQRRRWMWLPSSVGQDPHSDSAKQVFNDLCFVDADHVCRKLLLPTTVVPTLLLFPVTIGIGLAAFRIYEHGFPCDASALSGDSKVLPMLIVELPILAFSNYHIFRTIRSLEDQPRQGSTHVVPKLPPDLPAPLLGDRVGCFAAQLLVSCMLYLLRPAP